MPRCITFPALDAAGGIDIIGMNDVYRAVLEVIVWLSTGCPVRPGMNKEGNTVEKREHGSQRTDHTAERSSYDYSSCYHQNQQPNFEPEPPADHA